MSGLINIPEDLLGTGYARHVKFTVLILLWIEFGFTSWLNFRQIQKIDSQTEIPGSLEPFVYDIHDFRRSGQYSRALLVYTIAKKLYLTSVWTLVVIYKGIYLAWNLSEISISSALNFLPDFLSKEMGQNFFFSCFCFMFKCLVMLPPSMYVMLGAEKRFGFYSSSWNHWMKSYLKDTKCQITVMPLFMLVLVWTFKGLDAIIQSQNWLIILLALFIYWLVFPNLFMIFSLSDPTTFQHLDAGELKTRIEELADRVRFPKACIFVSSRLTGTFHSNAFHYGFLNFQRLVLFSTIIEGYRGVPRGVGLPPVLVEAVIAHELGHYSLSHSFSAISFYQIKILIILLLSMWLERKATTYTAFGFPVSDIQDVAQGGLGPIVPGLLIAVYLVLQFPLFIVNTLSDMMTQQVEYRADEFACSLGYGTRLQNALVKVSVDNCSYPDADYLYSLFCLTHPTAVKRIINIDSFTVGN